MKRNISLPVLLLLIVLFSDSTARAQQQPSYVYKPESMELYNAIAHMDSVYFNAYNKCDMDAQAAIFADSIEFYHDKSGLETSKKDLLAAIKDNICGKVSRVLVKGTLEVYQIPGYGAVEIALHRFINHMEHDHLSAPDKFIVIWRFRNNKWQITRVVSLHTGNK
jgi:Domain of unknown function (DUF4440)